MAKKISKTTDLPYRDCVGCVVFNRSGQVFIGKRLGDASGRNARSWQFPQGGIDKGEESFDAATRELFEETSIRSVRLLATAPDWIYYDLPKEVLGRALKGKYRGQRQKWFAFLLEGSDDEINVISPADGAHPAEFSDWRWENIEQTIELIVAFKRDAYREVVAAFKEIPDQLRRQSQTDQDG